MRLWDTVAYRDRVAERNDGRRAQQAISPSVDNLLSKGLDCSVVADRVRTDVSLSEPLRRAALNLVLKRCSDMRELAHEANGAWAPNQAAGPPNAQLWEDQETAWVTLAENAGKEWLDLDYEPPFIAHQVRIRETFNPGAVVELVLKGEDGREIVRIPVVNVARTAPEWLEVSFDATAVPVRSVRVILDTSRVAGWNEIDAVELVGPTHRAWAEAAHASSFYR